MGREVYSEGETGAADSAQGRNPLARTPAAQDPEGVRFAAAGAPTSLFGG